MKKKYVLKEWVKNALFILYIAVIIAMFYLVFRVTEDDKKVIDYCVSQGHPRAFCERGVFGY